MSRKNKAYGKTWLEWRHDLFCRRKYLGLYAWTHQCTGQWYRELRVVQYEVQRFESVAQYKAWRRAGYQTSFARLFKSVTQA